MSERQIKLIVLLSLHQSKCKNIGCNIDNNILMNYGSKLILFISSPSLDFFFNIIGKQNKKKYLFLNWFHSIAKIGSH